MEEWGREGEVMRMGVENIVQLRVSQRIELRSGAICKAKPTPPRPAQQRPERFPLKQHF